PQTNRCAINGGSTVHCHHYVPPATSSCLRLGNLPAGHKHKHSYQWICTVTYQKWCPHNKPFEKKLGFSQIKSCMAECNYCVAAAAIPSVTSPIIITIVTTLNSSFPLHCMASY